MNRGLKKTWVTDLITMKKTIGFSNKNNMWTSKYDYAASNYSTIDKKFFSSNLLIGADNTIAWRHNAGSVNTFYGASYVSTIAVAFGNKASENKIYKSMSLEGDGNFKNVVNAFTTSEFISPSGEREYINAGLVKNYGGIHYAHLGRDPRIRPTADLKYMGFFQTPRFGVGFLLDMLVEGSDNLYMLPVDGPVVGVGQGQSNSTKILFKKTESPNISYIRGAGVQSVTSSDKYSDISTDITIATQQDLQGAGLETAYQPNGLVVKIASQESLSTLGTFIQSQQANIISVFSLSDPKHAGDSMRGQYAEAHFSFPAQPFELYSLNLNYEPTSLDHSK